MARQDPLLLYHELVDYCNDSGYRVYLEYGRGGWTLEIMEGKNLIGRGESRETRDPVVAWRECASDAAISLGRSGRAKPRRRR